MPVIPPATAADRLAHLLYELGDEVVDRFGWISRWMVTAILWRVDRMRERFLSLAARAGRISRPPAPPREASAADGEERPTRGRDLSPQEMFARDQRSALLAEARAALPRHSGWLVALVPNARDYGWRVAALLEEPELLALLAGSPGFGRLIRPLCHMLGIDVPPAVRLGSCARVRGPRSEDELLAVHNARLARRRERRMHPVGELRSQLGVDAAPYRLCDFPKSWRD